MTCVGQLIVDVRTHYRQHDGKAEIKGGIFDFVRRLGVMIGEVFRCLWNKVQVRDSVFSVSQNRICHNS